MKRAVKHEIKLEKSAKVMLLIMALGICANAFHFTNPIEDAIEKADDDLRHLIHNGVFHEGLYEENSFDMVCMFQVLDHVVDPLDVMMNVARV